MYCRLIRRLQISFFLIFFLFCSAAISYSEELAATPAEELKSPADAVKDSTETVKKHIESVKNLINEIKGKTEIFKKQADTVVQKKADVINSLADIIQSQVEIVKSEAAKFVEKIKKTDASSVDEATIKSWNETIEGFKKRASDYSLQADKLKQDVDEFKKALVEPGYDTKHFFIQTGVVTLNPYKVKKDPADDKFKLSPSGEADTYVFIEALIRSRTAWDPSEFKKGWHFFLPDDYEARISFYGIKDSKRSPESAVVSGAGDAGGEVNVGWVILPSLDGKIKHTLNIEGIYGVIADKTVLNLHNYYGLGIVSVWGIPSHNNRNIEALAGIYSKIIQVPEFVNNSSLEVKTSNEYPLFTYRNALSLRLNIKIPYGNNGFLTVGGDFNNVSKTDNSSDLRGDSPITNSWSASLGITTPYEKLFGSLFNQ